MQLMSSRQVGKHKFTIVGQGENLYECQMDIQKASFPDVFECGKCKSDKLYLRAYKAKEKFEYLKIQCQDCKASVTFGKTQEDPNVMFLRRDKNTHKLDWQEYSENGKPQAAPVSMGQDEDAPF